MTLIRGRKCTCRERTSKDLLGSSPPPKSSHNKALVNPLAIGPSKPPITKYIKENLQKIFKTVLEAQAPPFDRPREKLLKARLFDVYCDKFHMEYYNFCQQCEDHFATIKAKGPNYILFAASFLHDHINFC